MSGNMYSWNFDQQPFKIEGSLTTTDRGENSMTYASANDKLFILGGNDGNYFKQVAMPTYCLLHTFHNNTYVLIYLIKYLFL